MNKLSVAIITFNEEDRLEDALKSCLPIADEIVLIDSFSTDKTVEIAEKYKCKILRHPFKDYGSQKNIALREAKYQWVLNLDADERVSPELQDAILEFKKNNASPVEGFVINRKTFYMGKWVKHSGWYPDRKLRLFRKDKSQWRGRVHEALVLEGQTTRMKGEILHYTYRDITDHVKRLNRYSMIQAKDIVQKKKTLLLPRAIILPGITFIRFYFWKLGILDGLPGLVIALVSSWATSMKYLKAIELKKGLNWKTPTDQ